MQNVELVEGKQLAWLDKSVFAQLREYMKKVGFHLFSEVVVDQNDAPYHVLAKFARVTSQFYWFERKQLIIMLTHTENTYGQGDEPTHLSGYWHMRVYFGFYGSRDKLVSLAPNNDITRVPFFDGNLIKDTFTPKGLYYTGGSYSGTEKIIEANYEFVTNFDCTSVTSITAAVTEIKMETERYLRPLPFAELWVYSFPPSYAFKGSEKIFWSRFDKRNLRALITRPYGSEGLER